MKRKRLAIITTHPIQYHAPWFRGLAAHPDLDLQVYFCHEATSREQAAAGFGVEFEWNVPMLEGYPFRFLRNVAHSPSISSFRGLDVPEIKEMIERERYDAVLVSGWNYKGSWQAILACWNTHTPVMVRGDSHLYTQRHPLKKALKYPFYRWFISRMDACLAVGTWSREYYLHYGAPSDRIFWVPHVVDERRFADDCARWEPHRLQLRREWEFADDTIIFGLCGKLIDQKRPFDFVEALALADAERGAIAGLVIGDGPLRKSCEQIADLIRLP